MTQKRIFLPVFILGYLLLCNIACNTHDMQDEYSPGTYTFLMNTGGQKREYIVHVPLLYEQTKPVAVVLMLHGGGGTAQGIMHETGWDQMADQAEDC